MATQRPRTARALGIVAALVMAPGLVGCGMDVQSLQPYTPAAGVNADQGAIKVRNLLLIADETGKGVVSASIVSATDDALSGIIATPQKADGSAGAPLTVAAANVALPANKLVVLTNPTPIKVTGADLKPGLTAQLTLAFSSGQQVVITAPVMSSSLAEFSSVPLG
ncbi:MAG: hypothetical protein WAS07_02265 [Micropruina sp.]|nr:hypothetical protein [Micropruina sp.]